MTQDPIKLAGGLNQYAYVDGNPVNWVDPLGLFAVDKSGAEEVLARTDGVPVLPEAGKRASGGKPLKNQGSINRIDNVINETLSGKKNFTSSMTLTTDEALAAGQKFLGIGYKEIGKPGSGVFHSADGKREFRIDSGSISGAHAPGVPHVHFGVKNPETGKYISNNHVPFKD